MRPALLDGETLTECFTNYVRAAPKATSYFPGTDERITAAELDDATIQVATALAARGVGPGHVVALLLRTDVRFLTVFFGVQRAGAACTVLPVPAGFGDQSGAVRRLARIISAAGISHVVLDASFEAIGKLLRAELPEIDLIDAAVAEPGSASKLPQPDPGALSVVQFTSGSTSEPKGVEIRQSTMAAGLQAIVVSGEFTPDDVFMQWVPTFHDMGLVGLFSNLLNGSDCHIFSPTYFLRRPAGLLKYFGENGGTMITGPNFSYDMLADVATPELLADIDLSPWRLAFNGAEPVSASTTRRFTAALAPARLSETVMYPVYGMAEATLAITFPRPGTPTRILTVDRQELGDNHRVVLVPTGHPSAKEVVSCGFPVHGIRMRLVRLDGSECGEGELGEVQIAGPAVTSGYYRNPKATAAAFDGTWFRTGDIGFQHDRELYVTGRVKDMVIVRGQNFFPEDIEMVAREVPGIYRMRCVAFADVDDHGNEVVRVVAEVEPRAAQKLDVESEIRNRVETEFDLTAVAVNLVKPRWITRTTSGKWQRDLTRRRIAELAAETPYVSASERTSE